MNDVKNLNGLHHTAANHKDALVQGINAGVDIYMNTWRGPEEFLLPMQDLVKSGRISNERLDDAVRRVLRLKFSVGLFENRYLDEEKSDHAFGSEEAYRVARQASREAICLLKNQNNLLPLQKGKYKKILVTGPNADNNNLLGDWTFQQPADNITTILEGIRQKVGKTSEVTYFNCGVIKGKVSKITKKTIESADPNIINQKIIKEGGAISDYTIAETVEYAKKNDLVIMAVGGQGLRYHWAQRTYGESCDRPSIALYGRQLELVKAVVATGTPVVVVMINGKPISEQWIFDNCPAVLECWEPGMFGGEAVADVLFGDYNPSGRLPITIPRSAGHIPQFYYMRSSRTYTGYSYGTSRYDDRPSYPFGYGLSYTTFKTSELQVPATVKLGEDVPISVRITNTGDRKGDYSVLCFVSDLVASIAPAVKELKAFDKISLESGESKVVKFLIPAEKFKLWNIDLKEVIEPGEFVVRIGDQTKSFWIK
jgi:beta-glucosidase